MVHEKNKNFSVKILSLSHFKIEIEYKKLKRQSFIEWTKIRSPK